MTTLQWTRKEFIEDLPHAYREQNNLSAMTDVQIAAAWMRYGIHAGTEDWDDVEVMEA